MNSGLQATGTDGPLGAIPSAALKSARADVPALARSLKDEARLLGLLREVLDRQRTAVSMDDLAGVDQTVFDAQRVLLSLSQARKRRRSLITLAVGDDTPPLSSLPDLLGDQATPELNSALTEVLEVASVVAREMELNRRILNGAVMAGDTILRALGKTGRKSVYDASAQEDASRSNLLLNRQV